MLFKFTLDNATQGTLIIDNPDGWKDFTIRLDRDQEYHSLIESIDVPLIFYGDNGTANGGYDYIKTVEAADGPDGLLTITIDISEDDGASYTNIFTGNLLLDTIRDISTSEFYKLECNISRNDFWSKFFNRKSIAVDIQSSTDIEGNTKTVDDPINLELTGQVIKERYLAWLSEINEFTSGIAGNNSVQLNFNANNLDYVRTFSGDGSLTTIEEFGTKYDIPVDETSSPVNIFTFNQDGKLSISITVVATAYPVPGTPDTDLKLKIDIAGSTLTGTRTNYTIGVVNWSRWVYTGSVNVIKGDTMTIYLLNDSGSTSSGFGIYGSDSTGGDLGIHFTKIDLTLDSLMDDSFADALLIHDVGMSICDRICGGSRNNVLYSEFLGSDTFTRRNYDDDGCAWQYAILGGLHIRGYTFADKPFQLSFDNWWAGLNPIFNLGCGYETISGSEYIRVEDKAYFYDSSSNSLNLDYVSGIERSYNSDGMYKKIEIGYNKWESENIGGIDDPQTRHEYATRFQRVGNAISLLSTFVAASLAIESTRRKSVNLTEDWRLDNDTFIIALNRNNASPNFFAPELDQHFDDGNPKNLNNPETRYNSILTPARNLLRWAGYLISGLADYLSSGYFYFSSGEGNTDMYADYTFGGNSCASQIAIVNGAVHENQDISIAALASLQMMGNQIYEFTHNLSFDDYLTIRNARTKSIGVSMSDSGHVAFFILSLEYKPMEGKAKFKLLKAS